MAANYSSSNTSMAAPEVGWQAGPQRRGTASILWNCISVIILITWTSFHPSVGINWRQRVPTTITATLLPQLSAIVAGRDYISASKLKSGIKFGRNRQGTDCPEWRDGWNMTKSFLVVKGGIRTRPDHGRLSNDPSSAQFVNTADEIIDTETFLLFAETGRIRYEDFPSTEQINDSSKADWFSKGATLAQLLWFSLNMVARAVSPTCDVSLVEMMVVDWIIFGITAAILWWKCPQNINIPYYIPINDCSMPAEASPPNNESELAMEATLGNSSTSLDLERSHAKDIYFVQLELDSENRLGPNAVILVIPQFIPAVALMLATVTSYQWHSTQEALFWVILVLLSILSHMILAVEDFYLGCDWGITTIYKTYIRPLVPKAPRICGGGRQDHKGLDSSEKVDIHSTTALDPRKSASERPFNGISFKSAAAAGSVTLLCHFGRLVIALMAFINAPDRIYNVPDTWILEAFGHVGG